MISIGILSHNSPITLENTLMSYKHHELLNLSDDIFCVIQPSNTSNEENEICKKYGIRCVNEPVNSWMQGGIKRVFNESKYENVLFTENDFRIHDSKYMKEIIEKSIKYLDSDEIDMVRIRSLKNPGHPLQIPVSLYEDLINNNKNRINDYIKDIHYSCHFLENPDNIYSEYIKKFDGAIPFLMSSKNCCYTNNCFITTKRFFKNSLDQYANINNPHFEPGVGEDWYKNNYKIGISVGFLTHVRIDGHSNCWCCHSKNGGTSDISKCQCCDGDYIDDLRYIINENGKDLSKYSNGVNKLNNLLKK